LLVNFKGNFEKAVKNLDKRSLAFYISAFQSYLFNQIVAKRIDTLDTVLKGDLAWKHDKGVVFLIEDTQKELPRARAGEISPSGPMYGKKMKWPEGEPLKIESQLLVDNNFKKDDFFKAAPLKCTGGRRPLRFFIKDYSVTTGADRHGDYMELIFSLDSGCYATVLLREIFKEGLTSYVSG
jgi:tRNA pseudouridine13 synthase